MAMPITVDDFDHLPETALDLTEGSNAQLVSSFCLNTPMRRFART